MTPEMAFECLLVSQNPAVVCTMDEILTNFSITTRVCCTLSEAANRLEDGSTDLIVIDLDERYSQELVQEVCKSSAKQKPTILAVVTEDRVVPGVHVVLRKPVTQESGTRSLRIAYTRMLQDYRRHVRYAVMASVLATDERNRTLAVTVTNIGDGGVGLTTREELAVGARLSFRLRLPGVSEDISIRARVLWTRPYGAAGCEFQSIRPFDLHILHGWLKARCQVKKPLIDSYR